MVRRVNNAGSIQWTKSLGPTSSGSASVGYSVSEVPKTIHTTPKIQNHLIFSVFTNACLSGRWEIVPWRWSVAVKCPEGGSRCFGRLKRKHSLDYIHARLHKVCKNHHNDFLTFLMATVYLQLQQARWCAECDYRQSWRSTEPGRHRVPGLPRKRFPICSRRVETRGLEAQPSRRISLEDQCHEHRGTSSGYVDPFPPCTYNLKFPFCHSNFFKGAKIRRDLKTSGYVVASTGFGNLPGGGEDNVVFLVKVSSDMALEWSQYYGQAGGAR